jgi:lipopolysaccharide/colanic/teichoic acid biosynthesis glycosyltransferase
MSAKLPSRSLFTKASKILKYILDRFVAAIAAIAFSPLLLVVAIAIYIRMGTPIVFTQPRPGQGGHIFNFYKFRTMTSECDVDGNLLPDEQRLTAIGIFLRKTSLDELPQLWNVLKGDMSLVGPRPLVPRYLPYYSERELKRHDVLPGITGLAQVNGRNELAWNERLALDVFYVENWSLWLDIQILLKTVYKVLRRESIAVAPSTIMMDLDEERRQSDRQEKFNT